MVTDARTTNRSYKKPATGNTVAEDFSRLIDAMDAIDTDVAGLLTSVSQRALLSHTHSIADVTGLQAALDAKAASNHTHALNDLTDVTVAGAANGQFLRLINGVWGPSAVAVAVANIDGATALGRDVMQAPDAAAIRTAAGATSTGSALVTAADAAAARTAVGATATGSDLMTAANAAAVRATAEVYSSAQVDAIAIRSMLRNRIVNGAFQHSQERGTAYVDVTTGGVYVVDQWRAVLLTSPGGTLRFQQVASPTPGGSPNRLRATVQVADTSIAAGDLYCIQALIEGQFIADARFGSGSAKPLVVRLGVNCSFAGTYGLRISNADGSRSWVSTFTVSPGDVNADLLISVPIPGDTTGTWFADNGRGMDVAITFAAGTTLQGAPGWQAGNFVTTSAQANFMGATGRTFELFDVGLYVDHAGTGIAPQWELPDFADELRRCQRYYSRGFDEYHEIPAPDPTFASTYPVRFKQSMRVAAVVTPAYTQTVNVNNLATIFADTEKFVHRANALARTNCSAVFNWTASARF